MTRDEITSRFANLNIWQRGDEAVLRAMSEYTEAWAFKHPSPWDYVFFMGKRMAPGGRSVTPGPDVSTGDYCASALLTA